MSKLDRLREYRAFLARAANRPATMGAILPTSGHVADAVAEVLPRSGKPTVLELGPGTGALSDAIHRRLPADAQHIALEIDPGMVHYLKTAKPWLRVIHGDARNLAGLLDSIGITQVDAVISSIPWTLMDHGQQRELLREVTGTLSPQGVLTTVTYLTTLWRTNTTAFVRTLHENFEEVLPRSTVWRNLPPARIYVCRRPISPD
ncbi:class I SAM-dependent methyltransferase [Parasphingorhabdus pacifica]